MTSPLAPFLDGSGRRARFSVRPSSPVILDPVDGLLAGVAERDITPAPGMPKAGYSANAHDGDGFRTRLRARVLHLRSTTASIALVQCDLLGGSSVIQHLVADAIADQTDVRLGGLMIGATHTHAGPGQFLGTDFYNRFASNRSGFDAAYTDFLVTRIAEAVLEAVDSRRPARMAVGRREVWGFTRNRSHGPHVANETVSDKRTDPQRKFVDVNPALELIRVDAIDHDGTAMPLAATVVFSVHGTGIPQQVHEYNADLWAYVVGELRHQIAERSGHDAVVGAIEGTHADVAPAIRPKTAGHLEAERIGRGIGAEAAELWASLGDQLSEDVTLGAGLREIDLERSPQIGATSLPRRPAVGAALVAGAHENLTPVIWRIPPFAPGRPKRHGTDNPQGAKWVIGSRWLQPLVLPLASFPRILPIQVLRLDNVLLVGLPFEVTVESGRRISAAVDDALGDATSTDDAFADDAIADDAIERVVVTSVANEYSGYVATAEEYSRQHYEGGHTLYGPGTQAFLAAAAAGLATQVAAGGNVAEVAAERRWDLKLHRYLPLPTHRVVERRALGDPRYSDPTARTDGFWSFEWLDVAPGDLHWHEPLVRVEASTDRGPWVPASHRGRSVDDQSWALEISHHGVETGGHRYRVRWYDPAFGDRVRHRFVILPNAGQPELHSPPFD